MKLHAAIIAGVLAFGGGFATWTISYFVAKEVYAADQNAAEQKMTLLYITQLRRAIADTSKEIVRLQKKCANGCDEGDTGLLLKAEQDLDYYQRELDKAMGG